MTDTKDERIKRLERAAREWHAAWIAEPALEVIRELQAELRLRDDVPEGHGWLPQAEWQRLLDVQKGRVEAAERRADALERASRQAKARLERGWAEAAMRELEAALAQQEPDQPFASHVATDLSHNAACVSHDGADQPAQDGGRDAGCRAEPGDGEVLLKIDGLPTISICADDVEGFGYDLNEAADGTKPQTGVTVRLQPDQPADAGEPSCCARTREECARLADRRADDLLSLANEAQREGASGTSHDLRQEAGQVRKVAAAIRRTGDTGGGDE